MLNRPVRATRTEARQPLPGDDLIPKPVGSLTHAVTITRPPHDVWPWLAQMGAGSRAGWYSYDFLDNGQRFQPNRNAPPRSILKAGVGRLRSGDLGLPSRRIPVSDRGTFGGLSQSVSQFGFAGSATSL
jgi:hypothetical protein